MKDVRRHANSFLAPIILGIALPLLIARLESRSSGRPVIAPPGGLRAGGLVVTVAGWALTIGTIWTFILIGQGTIMPWDPTRKLVIAGPYRHVRNPMILGLIIAQVGEALLFASYGIALLAALNLAVNTVYFIHSEEPGLEKRFGQEYVEYRKNVPRWMPRLKPWRPA